MNQIRLSIPSNILMGTTPSSPSPSPSAVPSSLPDYDIIKSVPPAGYTTLSFIEFCTGLLSSQEATHATVTSVTRWINRWGVPHRFLILHVVSTGNKDLFFRLDRRRDPQESSVSSTASDGVGSIHTITMLSQNIIMIGSGVTSPRAPSEPKGDERSRVEIGDTSTTRRDWTGTASSVRYMP